MCQSSSANDECDESDGIWLLKTYVAAVCYQFGNFKGLRGQGVPWDHIMEHEFEYISDREGHGGHLAEKFLKKILFLSRVIAVTVSRFACRY